jgi:hypothetical protein
MRSTLSEKEGSRTRRSSPLRFVSPRRQWGCPVQAGYDTFRALAKPRYLYASGWLVNKVTNLGQHSVTHLHVEQFGRLGDLEILFEILEHRGTKFRARAQ